MRSLLFKLVLPLLALSAAPQAFGAVQCDATRAIKLSSEQLALAAQTEAVLRNGGMTPDLANVDAIHSLSLSQFAGYRQREATSTAHVVATIWQRETPSAAIAARAYVHAQQQQAQTNCPAAEELFSTALEIARKALGDGDILTVRIMHELAILYRLQRRLPERLALYRRIADVLRADPTLGARLPELYLEMSDMAFRNKDFKQAEQYARDAMAHLDKGAKPPPRAVATALYEAAAALYAQNQLQEGDKLRDRANTIVGAEGVAKSSAPQAAAVDSVAALYKSGQIDAALAKALQRVQAADAKMAELTQALTVLQADPASQPALATAARKGELAKASRAIEAQQRDSVYALADAGELYQSQGRLAEAEPLYRKANAMLTWDKASKSTLAARLARDLGILARKKGDMKEAVQFQQIAYANVESELGPDHPDALEAQAELAYLFAAQGKLTEAGEYYAALAAREEQRADADRDMLSDYLLPLAEVQVRQGNLSGAESNFNKVALLWRQGGTKNAPYLMAGLTGLGKIYTKQGKVAEAKRIDTELAALKRAK
ncbi:tetratricopeptide repeat protein [Massilia sp. TWP1-3-3]|uniref:tetratricopeptide repeat protein n=1 Tax=Massilia sp. TWP1-3-3 TaxID=2804573 RepID=UPI003CE98B62